MLYRQILEGGYNQFNAIYGGDSALIEGDGDKK